MSKDASNFSVYDTFGEKLLGIFDTLKEAEAAATAHYKQAPGDSAYVIGKIVGVVKSGKFIPAKAGVDEAPDAAKKAKV